MKELEEGKKQQLIEQDSKEDTKERTLTIKE